LGGVASLELAIPTAGTCSATVYGILSVSGVPPYVPDVGDLSLKIVSYLKALAIICQGSLKWEQIRK